MKTSPFEAAPEDILRLVFKVSSKDDVVRLSKVNWRFKELLEPEIYHTIDWVWEEDSIPPIHFLLRTILTRPELASWIRNVKLTGETFHLPPFRMKKPPRIRIPKSEIGMIIAVVKESGVPNTIQWIDALGGGRDAVPIDNVARSEPMHLATMDAVLAVLLSRLQNLTILHLGPNFTKETTILGGMLKTALCGFGEKNFGISNFEKLREVTFSPRICIEKLWGRGNNDEKPNNSPCSLIFFSAPAIEHITATIEEPQIFQWPGSPPSPSTLTSLDLTLLREGTISHILSRCRNLQTLAYHFYADKASKHSHDRVQRSLRALMVGERLMSSLALVQGTLKSLVLTAHVTAHDFDGHEGDPESIDKPISLRGSFLQLETLEIPIVFLLGWAASDKMKFGDVLPENVRSVTLNDDTWWGITWPDHEEIRLLNLIEEWFNDYRVCTPRLEKVRLVIKEMDEWYPEAMERFNIMGVNAGIEIEFEKLDPPDDYFWPRVGYMEG